MKKILPALLIGLCFGLPALRAQSTAQQRCDAFGKGVNLSNWLEAYWQTGWPTPQGYTKSFLQQIKPSGMHSIRLPIYMAGVVDTVPPYAVDTTHVLFARMDSAIAWADELGMRLIIDNHHGWPLTDSTWRTYVPRMKNVWGAVARRYAHLDPEQFTFELLNEPPMGFHNDSLNLLYGYLIDTIRTYAPQHSIIASPNFAGIGLGFLDYVPLADTNIIYTFHTYDPYPFTHQGFSWSDPFYAAGATYPDPNGYDFLVPLSWDMAAQWKNTYQLPVFLGEFGVGVFADDASRCHWMDTVGRRIHENNLSWFYWDVLYDFQIYRSAALQADSIIPCFGEALFLYEDSLNHFSVAENMPTGPDVNIFPNPTGGVFHCQTSADTEISMIVYDAAGRTVFSKAFIQQLTANTENWPSGTYFLKIGAKNGVVWRKLVVKR